MRRKKLLKPDCTADSKTILLLLCEVACFVHFTDYDKSHIQKNILSFSTLSFLFSNNPFCIVNFHSPCSFCSLSVQVSGFSQNIFPCAWGRAQGRTKIYINLRNMHHSHIHPYLSFLRVSFISALK